MKGSLTNTLPNIIKSIWELKKINENAYTKSIYNVQSNMYQ